MHSETLERVSWPSLGAALAAERERWALWLPVAVGTGIAVYFSLPVEPPAWLGLAGLGLACALALVALLAGRASQALLLLALALGAIALGLAAAQLRTALVEAPVLTERFGPNWIQGQVLSVEARVGEGGRGVRVVLHRVTLADVSAADTPERVRLRQTSKDPARLLPGQWIRLRGVLRPPPEPAAPGAFDFARQAFFQRLGAVGYAVGHARLVDQDPAETAVEGDGFATRWLLAWASLRRDLAERIMRALPGETGAVAAALMTGERSAIPESVIAAMRDSGLAHLLAISGLHVGLIAGLLFFGVRSLLALIPALALRYPIKKWAAAVAALGAFGYLLLVGATVPTQRAFLMISLVLLAVVLDRSAVSMRLVAWAALAVLLIAPESLLSASFQMSFGAVIALVAAYESLAQRQNPRFAERGLGSRLGLYVGGVALTSVIAILATAPFAIYHFNRIALYGLAANLVAVPATAFWIMPWALVAFMLMPFGLEGLALTPMGWGIDLVIAVARTVAGWPGAVTPVRAMPMGGLILIVLGGLWLCLWLRPWRLIGLPLILAGLFTIAMVRPPDVLASGDAKLLAVKAPDATLWLSSLRIEKFTADIWLRRAGLRSARAWPHNGTLGDGMLRCDALGCVYRRDGQIVAVAQQGQALFEDCRLATVLISLEPLRRIPCPAPRVIVDRFDLWAEGAHAIWLTPNGAEVETVAEVRGLRPWAPQRRRFGRRKGR